MKTAASSNGFGKAFLLVGALALLLCGACADTEGTTPKCVQNVDKNGITDVAEGCNKFAVCEKGPPSACCEGITNDLELKACLYGYGDVDALGGSGGGGGGG